MWWLIINFFLGFFNIFNNIHLICFIIQANILMSDYFSKLNIYSRNIHIFQCCDTLARTPHKHNKTWQKTVWLVNIFTGLCSSIIYKNRKARNMLHWLARAAELPPKNCESKIYSNPLSIAHRWPSVCSNCVLPVNVSLCQLLLLKRALVRLGDYSLVQCDFTSLNQ